MTSQLPYAFKSLLLYPPCFKPSIFFFTVQGKLPCGDGCGENDEDKEEEEDALMGPNQSGLEVDNDSEHSSGKDSGTGTDNDPRLHIYSHHHLSLHDPGQFPPSSLGICIVVGKIYRFYADEPQFICIKVHQSQEACVTLQ